MKKIFLLSGLILLSLWMIRCKDSLEDATFAAYDEKPVGIYLESQPEYSEWTKLLKRTNLYNALNISKVKFTCFVADNNAVQAYLKLKNYNTVEDIPMEEAIYLMRYHIIPGNAYMHTAFAGQIKDTTASGDYLTVNYRQGGINAIYVNDTSLIVRRDIEVINGFIHKIDRVLDPITESVWDLISQNANYSIFQEAIKLCQLEDWLSVRNKVVNETSRRDYKTVFVVSDETFKAAGINSVEDLKNRYPSPEYTSDTSAFRRYVTYHIINSNSDFGALSTFAVNTKIKNVETVALNTLFSVEDMGKNLVINRNTDSVLLVAGKYDRHGNNGYVHEVNHLMPLSTPKPATVRWDFCDIEDCRILDAYGKYSDALDQKAYPLDRENPIDIEWFTAPDNSRAVQYQYRKSVNNNDYLLMNLGYVGWVEIKTPPIVAGKYKITITKMAWSARGTCQTYIDNEKIGPQLNFSAGGGDKVELGTKNFAESGRHTVKFSAIKKGVMEVDLLIFEPVK